MTDFLGNLLLRHTAQAANVLQPRLPSVFEAPNRQESLPVESFDQVQMKPEVFEHPVIERDHTSADVPTEKSPFRESISTIIPEMVQPETGFIHPRNQPAELQPQPSAMPSETTRPDFTENRSERILLTSVQAGNVKDEKAPNADPIMSVRQGIEKDDRSLLQGKKLEPSQRQPTMTSMYPQKLEPKFDVTGIHQDHTAVSKPIFHPVAIPATATVTQLFEQPQQSRPPVIEVHIGRIEVRATQSAAATSTRPAATSGSKLSLEDYLRGERK